MPLVFFTDDEIIAAVAEAVARERECCAVVADAMARCFAEDKNRRNATAAHACEVVASAIRLRGD